jgi:hypothetical protein
MNWVSYLVNELKKDYHKVRDQGYGFHFSWFLVLITFVSWKMSEGDAFLEIEPFEPLATKFSTLWYMNDMSKQWQSNVVFHAYYQQNKGFHRIFSMHESTNIASVQTITKVPPRSTFHLYHCVQGQDQGEITVLL